MHRGKKKTQRLVYFNYLKSQSSLFLHITLMYGTSELLTFLFSNQRKVGPPILPHQSLIVFCDAYSQSVADRLLLMENGAAIDAFYLPRLLITKTMPL